MVATRALSLRRGSLLSLAARERAALSLRRERPSYMCTVGTTSTCVLASRAVPRALISYVM